MICNVVINAILYTSSSPNKNKPHIFDGMRDTFLTTTRKGETNKQRNIYRHIITYADDITITTTNKNEIPYILANVAIALKEAGLNISTEKTKTITYDTKDKIKFDYLGFTFYYVPKEHIKKGGIITRNDDITERKYAKNEDGTYLVYPSRKNFDNIKQKTKNIIQKLTRLSMLEVLNELNPVIRGYSEYFAWSLGYNRLKTLDGLIFRNIKKYLIRKYRLRGIRRPS